MKLSKLFMLCGVLLMVGTSAKAELVNGVRQRPNVAQTEAFQVDAEYYLFNTGARMFFVGANDWTTRASVGTNGYKVKIVESEYAPDGAYEFTDCVETRGNQWMCVFATSDAGAIWVDNSNETYRYWEFTEVDGKYRISNSDLAYVADAASGAFLGWNGTDDTRLYFVKPATAGVGVDWVFVSEDTYWAWQNEWESMKDQFEAAAELLTYLNGAKEKGLNVAAEIRIYQNEAATVEELNAATAAVQKKIHDAMAGNASVSNPSDMTGSLMNPNFDNASAAGWKGTSPNMVGNGSHAPANVAEHYSKTFDTYQELSNMAAGVYKLENNGFHRGWWDDYVNKTGYTAFLYAYADNEFSQVAMANPWEALNEEPMSGDTEFGTYASESEEYRNDTYYYAPNDPSAARLYFEKGYYKNQVFFAIEDGSYLRLGVKKEENRSSEWAVFDNFKLTYYGNEPEAYQYWINNLPKAEYNNVNVSDQYLKAYDAVFKATASNKAEAKAAVEGIKAAEEVMAVNISLWNELKAKYDDGIQKSVDYNYLESAEALSEYLLNTVEDLAAFQDEPGVKTGGADLDNDQLWVMIDRINALMAAVDKEAKENLQPGQDVTELLTNPGFEDGRNGWTVVSNGGGNVQLGGNNANHCFEAWHSTNFDVYQEVTGLPVGVYEVSVQGYVRYMDGNDAINHRAEEPANVPIYVYMNDSKTNLVSWFSYPKPVWFYQEVSGAFYLYEDDDNAYPDNMIAASAAFAEGGYSQTAKCLVTEAGGVTRIGVKGTPEAKFWPIFDNFKLTYLGYDIDVVKPLLEEKVAEVQMWTDVMTTKTAKATLAQALEAANVALRGNNGLSMFSSVARLEKAVNDVMEGIVLCESLLEEANAFLAYASESESPLAQQGQQLAATILSDLEECKYDEADLEVQSLAIRAMKLKMELPADYAQGSADGVDVTAFIQTPSFSKTVNWEETNSADGWQGIGGSSFGNDYEQRSALAIEFYEKSFDMYQDIAGIGEVVLPKGNYRLQVNAFERVDEASPAYLYVETNNGVQQVELMRHADGYDVEAGEEGPYNMISSAWMFEDGRYLNSIDFYSDGETFRIGVKHENVYSYDWIIMDNFKLFYFGDNGAPVVNEDNILYIADGLRFSKNKTNQLPVSMKNVDQIVGFQLDVVLPEGMTLAFDDEGEEDITTTNRSKNHSITSNILSDGSIRLVGTNLSNKIISGTDGVLLNIGVEVADWLANGEYAIQLKNVKMTNENKQTLTCADKTFIVKIGGKMGDVNHDDAIDVTDAVLIIDDILMKNPANFDASLADVNNDGSIDVTDVVMVIDAILGKITLARGVEASQKDLSAYTAFQMDLTIPVGYVLEGVELTEIAKDSHKLAYNMLSDGRCRVVVFSMDNEALPGAWDEVIRLNLRGQGDATVNVDRAMFVTVGGERHELLLNGTTSIAQLSTLNSQFSIVYDLQGRKVEKTAKGVYVIDGKKVVIK